MLGIIEDLIGQARFDHAPFLHDHQPVGEKAGDGEIVRDDHDGEPEIAHEAAQQVEQACLHRDVETRPSARP